MGFIGEAPANDEVAARVNAGLERIFSNTPLNKEFVETHDARERALSDEVTNWVLSQSDLAPKNGQNLKDLNQFQIKMLLMHGYNKLKVNQTAAQKMIDEYHAAFSK